MRILEKVHQCENWEEAVFPANAFNWRVNQVNLAEENYDWKRSDAVRLKSKGSWVFRNEYFSVNGEGWGDAWENRAYSWGVDEYIEEIDDWDSEIDHGYGRVDKFEEVGDWD